MNTSTSRTAMVIALVIIATTTTASFVTLRTISDPLQQLLRNQQLTPPMQPDFTTTWTYTDPNPPHGVSTHTVNTYCGKEEPRPDCVARHAADVAAMQAIYPPDPE